MNSLLIPVCRELLFIHFLILLVHVHVAYNHLGEGLHVPTTACFFFKKSCSPSLLPFLLPQFPIPFLILVILLTNSCYGIKYLHQLNRLLHIENLYSAYIPFSSSSPLALFTWTTSLWKEIHPLSPPTHPLLVSLFTLCLTQMRDTAWYLR